MLFQAAFALRGENKAVSRFKTLTCTRISFKIRMPNNLNSPRNFKNQASQSSSVVVMKRHFGDEKKVLKASEALLGFQQYIAYHAM